MEVTWDDVTLKRNNHSDSDPFLEEKAKEAVSYADRKKILPPTETVYRAEKGYKGAHYDHFANFFHAIRHGGTVVEDPVFGFRPLRLHFCVMTVIFRIPIYSGTL